MQKRLVQLQRNGQLCKRIPAHKSRAQVSPSPQVEVGEVGIEMNSE